MLYPILRGDGRIIVDLDNCGFGDSWNRGLKS